MKITASFSSLKKNHEYISMYVAMTAKLNSGFSLFLDNQKYLLNFTEYPWFKNASGEEILNVKLLNSHHLYWESLDIDLELDSIKNPDSYPLSFKS